MLTLFILLCMAVISGMIAASAVALGSWLLHHASTALHQWHHRHLPRCSDPHCYRAASFVLKFPGQRHAQFFCYDHWRPLNRAMAAAQRITVTPEDFPPEDRQAVLEAISNLEHR